DAIVLIMSSTKDTGGTEATTLFPPLPFAPSPPLSFAVSSTLDRGRRRCDGLAPRVCGVEEQGKQNQDGGGACRWHHPDALPLMGAGPLTEHVDDPPRRPRPEEHPDAERDERDESLCGCAQIAGRLPVYVDLPGHEKE